MKLNSTLFCILLFVLTSTAIVAKAQAVNVTDSLALVDLYNSTNGPGWYLATNWLTKKPVSKWYGIIVTGTRVTEIILSGNFLSGSIPSSIGNLENLTYLGLQYNQLTGSIPSSIGNLVNLRQLSLGENQLSGSIPASIGNLVNLIELDLINDQLSGHIPSSIGNLVNLVALDLFNNQLGGPIPSSIGNLVNLTVLYLNDNQLSGTIPSSIGNLVKLPSLDLSNNQLSRHIPSSIGNLNLLSLDLSNNQLSGHIPSSIGNLVNLHGLDLSHNQLTGNIPASLLRSGALSFDLSHNQLYQSSNSSFPVQSYNIRGDISYNNFTFNGIEFMALEERLVTYAPQAEIGIHKTGNILSVSAGGTLSSNTYKWFKVGSTDTTVINGDSTFQPTQSGKYYAHVKNAIAYKLTLRTDTVNYTMPVAQTEKIAANAVVKTLNHFKVYPNPAHGIIHITVPGTADISITNAAGNRMFTKSINNTGDINVSNLAAGTYYIQNKTSGEVQKIEVIR